MDQETKEERSMRARAMNSVDDNILFTLSELANEFPEMKSALQIEMRRLGLSHRRRKDRPSSSSSPPPPLLLLLTRMRIILVAVADHVRGWNLEVVVVILQGVELVYKKFSCSSLIFQKIMIMIKVIYYAYGEKK